MAGLGSAMKPGMGDEQQETPAAEQSEPPAHDAAEGEQPNVSEEEQAIYEQAVKNAIVLIYPRGEEARVSPEVLKALGASDNPILNMAHAAVTIVVALRESAKEAQRPIPDDVLLHVGVAVVEELAEVAEAAKIHDYSEEEQEKSLYSALDMYRDAAQQSGDINQDDLKQGFGQIVEADRAGQLNKLLPGIDKRMKEDG